MTATATRATFELLHARLKLSPLVTIAWVLALLVMLPVLAIAVQAAAVSQSLDTLQHLVQTVLPEYVLHSIALSLLAVTGAILLGTGAACLVALLDFPGRKAFEWLLVLPLAAPAYVVAYAYTDLLQFAGPVQSALRQWMGWQAGDYWFPEIRSLWGAAMVFALTLYPYVYLLARNAFLERSPSLFEAARTLGYGELSAFFRVLLPLARPAVLAGAALVLMETLADYGAVAYFAVPSFTAGIYRAWFSMSDRATAAMLATVLLVAVVFALWLERVARGRAKYHGSGVRRLAPRRDIRGFKALLAVVGCLIPIAGGFLLPVVMLLRLHRQSDIEGLDPRYGEWLWNTVSLGATAAIAVTVLALLLAYAVRLNGRVSTAALVRVAASGYAVPGLVVALGLLAPLVWGRELGLPVAALVGSVGMLLYAYAVRFLAVALSPIETGLQRISPSLDASSRSLGFGPMATLWRVHVPLLWRSVGAAGLLVFVDTMKELPATLVLRPLGYDSLAVIAHQFASDERLAEAALPSLTIVAVGLVPLILLSRSLMAGERH